MAKRTKSDTTELEPTDEQDVATLNLEGRGKYRRQLEKFAELKDEDKHRQLKDTWKEVAMVAASRAKQFAATCSPKDFGRLYQLVMTGAVSIDKAFPKQEQLNSPSLVVNMFGTLGQRAAAIAMPQTPETITVQAKEITWPDSATTKTLSLPTVTETSDTTKPSTPPSNSVLPA